MVFFVYTQCIVLNFEVDMDTNSQLAKLKKSRNITLIVAVLVSASAAFRWFGLYETEGFSPWVSTILAILLFASATHTHSKIKKL